MDQTDQVDRVNQMDQERRVNVTNSVSMHIMRIKGENDTEYIVDILGGKSYLYTSWDDVQLDILMLLRSEDTALEEC